jgi:single-stranded-DNA-specific exonuclease
VAGVDLGAAVRAAVAKGLLVKGGGHAMAAGLTLKRERLADADSIPLMKEVADAASGARDRRGPRYRRGA